MALDDLELSLMAFPQRWDGTTGALSLHVLLLPGGDPTAALGGGPKFAGTAVSLVINLASGLDSLPSTATATSKTASFVATPPTVAPSLFSTLFNQLVAKGITVTSNKLKKAQAPPAQARILKSLPQSYTTAFPFEKPRTGDISAGDGFGCALRAQAPGLNVKLPPPDSTIAWGQVLSYALRQPVLAQDLGLVYPLTLTIPAALLTDGGYLWVALDTSSNANPWVADFKAKPDTVKSYAARIPDLDAVHGRSLFAATLFPIVATPPSNLTQAQLEAEQYDDGFAQIVHSNQPATIDTATLDPNQIATGTEAGIQIGWDDEQVTVWLNNQIDLLRDRVGGSTNTPEAPLGVQGYRVDVRLKGTAQWNSLCVVNGTLPFDQTSFGNGASTSITGTELWIAPAPIRPSSDDNSTNSAAALLPLYFAQWAGSSLVLPDPVVQLLAYAVNAANTSKTTQPLPPLTLPNPNPDLTGVPSLLYGNDYEFRVRLVDLTGGGPLATDKAVHAGPAPTTQVAFRRHVPPKTLEVLSSPPPPPFPAKPPAVRRIQTLAVRRPRINYPEAVFAGVDPSVFARSSLGTLIQEAWASGRAIGVPDPDVDRFEARVEAHVPAHDNGPDGSNPGDLDGVFRVIYSVEVPFPVSDDPTVILNLNYTDGIDDISTVVAPPSGTVDLPIPTSRDIRVRLFPKAAARPNYYASDMVTIGLSSDYVVRQEAVTEDALFPTNPETQLQAFYFQPGANIPQLLVQEIGLQQQGFIFSGAPGVRTVFGASGGIRHSITADDGTLAFSNQTELLGQWIVALALDLQRDWTWDGFGQPSLRFQREGREIGVIAFPRVIADEATGNPRQAPNRSFTRVIFFDAVNSQPVQPNFPSELHLHYTVTASFTAASPQQFSLPIRLPITTPPVQTPKIVSTGIAESPYEHSPDYSETTLRDRYLWVEFDQSLQDDNDAYFARVLAYGPDPLLAGALFPKPIASQMLPENVEPPLPIDPELVRQIFSGQSADDSGLDAMMQMVPADKVGVGTSGTFFLLPFPSGLSSEDLDLFGFWTYEFRVGHVKFWSTAQGRFGRPLRVSGLQHPAPHLICAVRRDHSRIDVTAPYAVTVYNGNRLYNFQAGDPQTRIWFMLYAQVLQADAASHRNVLLHHLLGKTLFDASGKVTALNPQHGSTRDPQAGTAFFEKDIDSRLALLGLPRTTALSVLAVELLPGPLNVPSDRPNIGDAAANLQEDPLGANLGLRRILRTSTLTAVPAIC